MTDDLTTRLRKTSQLGNPDWHRYCIRLVTEAADRIDELEAEVEAHKEETAKYYREVVRLRTKAAEDIAWMSGIGPIPDEALDYWRRIQDRWLVDQYEIPPPFYTPEPNDD